MTSKENKTKNATRKKIRRANQEKKRREKKTRSVRKKFLQDRISEKMVEGWQKDTMWPSLLCF
jgi:hypothetical protein